MGQSLLKFRRIKLVFAVGMAGSYFLIFAVLFVLFYICSRYYLYIRGVTLCCSVMLYLHCYFYGVLIHFRQRLSVLKIILLCKLQLKLPT